LMHAVGYPPVVGLSAFQISALAETCLAIPLHELSIFYRLANAHQIVKKWELYIGMSPSTCRRYSILPESMDILNRTVLPNITPRATMTMSRPSLAVGASTPVCSLVNRK